MTTMNNPSDVLMVLGDGPSLPSGLARIARELCTHLATAMDTTEDYHCRWARTKLIQLGVEEPPWAAGNYPWEVIPLRHQRDWGGQDLVELLRQPRFARLRITLLTIYDPARCVEITSRLLSPRATPLPLAVALGRLTLAGYFAVDAVGPYPGGGFGGPAAEALSCYDHIAAYTAFGARVLRASLTRQQPDVQHLVTVLPHGISSDWFNAVGADTRKRLTARAPGITTWLDYPAVGVGCVATNQPRKDLALLFRMVAQANTSQRPLKLWLHTDFAVGAAWSIPELMSAYGTGMEGRILVTTSAGWSADGGGVNKQPWSDEELKALYSACTVTVAPGLGEGWGYPIVESAACGVPVIASSYAGGGDVMRALGMSASLLAPVALRTEGAYLLRRPVHKLELAVNVLVRELAVKSSVEAYDIGIKPLARQFEWYRIWPRWEAWLAKITGRTPHSQKPHDPSQQDPQENHDVA